jgi:hypothetical protein
MRPGLWPYRIFQDRPDGWRDEPRLTGDWPRRWLVLCLAGIANVLIWSAFLILAALML